MRLLASLVLRRTTAHGLLLLIPAARLLARHRSEPPLDSLVSRPLRASAAGWQPQPTERGLACSGSPHLPYCTRPKVGECTTCSSLPLPRYICTPQGRHGSKLRTARIISMPLNLSGPFSSKIGVFWTASRSEEHTSELQSHS